MLKQNGEKIAHDELDKAFELARQAGILQIDIAQESSQRQQKVSALQRGLRTRSNARSKEVFNAIYRLIIQRQQTMDSLAKQIKEIQLQ